MHRIKSVRVLVYLAMIAVNKKRVVFLIQHYFHNRLHSSLWNIDFFGTLHFNDAMTNSIHLHEALKFRRKFFVDKRAVQYQYLTTGW